MADLPAGLATAGRSIARKWLDEGIRDRCITRDLSWGVPVPKPGFEGKVFYVWFDAPIEYIAATQEWSDVDPERRNWRSWWLDADEVRYVQFLGKDNVPFTPSPSRARCWDRASLGKPWTSSRA